MSGVTAFDLDRRCTGARRAAASCPHGALGGAAEILGRGMVGTGAAQHLWMAGGIGLMTLAVMTRATLGHTGRVLAAGPGTTALYGAIIVAVLLRIAAGAWTAAAGVLHSLAGASWIAAFAGFAAIYAPMLLRPRPSCSCRRGSRGTIMWFWR
jgi:uncharacterized protein involved in response to NO